MHDSKSKGNMYAVVPAAGAGRRMGASLAKQYLPLLGKTILEHTLTKLLSITRIQSIVVVVAPDDDRWRSMPLFNNTRISVVEGGDERSQSVLNGLHALSVHSDANDWVLVHDVARPCVNPGDIDEMFSTLLNDHVGGILAIPCTDTIKQVSEQHIDKTIDRTLLWRAQTPQLFKYGLLVEAVANALEQGLSITDEASAMEFAGHRPKVIEGGSENIKITHPSDLPLAEFYLKKADSGCV